MTEARPLAELLCGRFLPTQREWLAADPVAAIESLTDLTVEVREPGDVGSSSCSVEGIYFETDRKIRVMRSTSARRTKFTALHELGHDQARNTDATARIIFGLPRKAGTGLEERIADAFDGSGRFRTPVPAESVQRFRSFRTPGWAGGHVAPP